MIPAGVEPVDAAGVARIRGVTLGRLRNSGVLKSPGFPAALNSHRKRDLIWDPAEVVAHRDGLPLPTRAAPSPDDLLDEFEAAAVVGIAEDTLADQAERLGIPVQHIELHVLRYYRRGDLERRHTRPPGGPGRPPGAKDLTPRKKRGVPSPVATNAAKRIEALAAYLAELRETGAASPSVPELAERYGVTGRTIQRWLARIGEPG